MSSHYEFTSAKAAIARFFAETPGARKHRQKGKTQNKYPADVRCAFVDWIDQAERAGRISAALADSITLET